MSQITTKTFLERLKKVDPKMQLTEADEPHTVSIDIPGDDLRRFMRGETQFSRGTYKHWANQPKAFDMKPSWTVLLDQWLDADCEVNLQPMENRDAFRLLIHLPTAGKT